MWMKRMIAMAVVLGLAGVARAGEFDGDRAAPAKAAAQKVAKTSAAGSEMDKESPTQAWRGRGYGYHCGFRGGYGGYCGFSRWGCGYRCYSPCYTSCYSACYTPCYTACYTPVYTACYTPCYTACYSSCW